MLKVYSASQVSFVFAGIPIDGGRGDDEFVEIQKQEETYTYKAGIDGEGTRSESKNTYTKVTLTLMRTSSANAALSAIHEADKAIPGGQGIAPILIRDRQGASILSSPQAWITKTPDQTYAKEANTVKWEFGVHDPENILGGN